MALSPYIWHRSRRVFVCRLVAPIEYWRTELVVLKWWFFTELQPHIYSSTLIPNRIRFRNPSARTILIVTDNKTGLDNFCQTECGNIWEGKWWYNHCLSAWVSTSTRSTCSITSGKTYAFPLGSLWTPIGTTSNSLELLNREIRVCVTLNLLATKYETHTSLILLHQKTWWTSIKKAA